MTKVQKVDLTLIKKLVNELEMAMETADNSKESGTTKHPHERIVDLSKAAGIATSMAMECSYLSLDIQALIKDIQMTPGSKDDVSKLLSNLLKPGGSN